MIGSEECDTFPDIVLTGGGVLPEHCRISLRDGVATILPDPNAQCWLNTVLIDKPAKLSQGIQSSIQTTTEKVVYMSLDSFTSVIGTLF